MSKLRSSIAYAISHRWLRRWTEPRSPKSARHQGTRVDGVVLPRPRMAENARHEDGETGVDNEIAEQSFAGIGAWILGRNMSWTTSWKGWWGDEPPYHTPVFVLTHHPRAPLKMAGGTEFRFVTEGIHAALEQAKAAAGGRDVRLGGGVSTIRQYLRAALIDELHMAIRPVLLGSGEHLWNGIDVHALGYECTNYVAGERATHVFLGRRA